MKDDKPKSLMVRLSVYLRGGAVVGLLMEEAVAATTVQGWASFIATGKYPSGHPVMGGPDWGICYDQVSAMVPFRVNMDTIRASGEVESLEVEVKRENYRRQLKEAKMTGGWDDQGAYGADD